MTRLLTKEEKTIYEEQLYKCGDYDSEIEHIEADKILCDVLTKMGYVDIVRIFNGLLKWYA